MKAYAYDAIYSMMEQILDQADMPEKNTEHASMSD
jgi:hypothetical protein